VSGEVVGLRLAPSAGGDADIVAEIEGLLARARSGEVLALAYAVTLAGGAVRTGWQEAAAGPWDCWRLAAGVEQLRARMHRAIGDS